MLDFADLTVGSMAAQISYFHIWIEGVVWQYKNHGVGILRDLGLQNNADNNLFSNLLDYSRPTYHPGEYDYSPLELTGSPVYLDMRNAFGLAE